MQAKLLSCSVMNPALRLLDEAVELASFRQMEARGVPFAETLIEFAGRVCYRSTARMGTAPGFIAARVREGHEDILEHGWAVVEFTMDNIVEDLHKPSQWKLHNPHLQLSQLWLPHDRVMVSANLRVWLDLFRRGYALEALPYLLPLAPAVFAEFSGVPDGLIEIAPPTLAHAPLLSANIAQGPMCVSLLGFTPDVAEHGAATFLIEGVSRTCTHQLVRHRMGSFSQESQRYVSLEKGGWRAIVPPAIAANAQAAMILQNFWQEAEHAYADLRALGIGKEDARFLLPNAAETRIVVTMPFSAWSHFLWLRAVDKAAQWEIRQMGQAILHFLYSIAPGVFEEQWHAYLREFGAGVRQGP